MAEAAFRRRRSRKLFGGDDEIYNPPPPPPVPFEVPLPPVDVNLPTLPPPPKQDSEQSLTLTIVLPVFFASVFLSCFFRLMSLRERRRSRRAAAAEQPQQPPQEGGGESGEVYSGLMVDHPIWYIRTVGLHSSVINAIAVCKYKDVEALVGRRAECAVCLNGFQDDDTLRMLPRCNHAFHVSCIDTWLKSHKNCPVCRAIIELVDVKFAGGGNRPETRTGTPDNNRRGQRADTEDLELRNNIVKNENEGD